MPKHPELPLFDYAQVLPPFGFRFPTRMSVLPLGEGKLALVSPVPIDDALAAELATLGEVAFLIAPCLLHDLYLAAAIKRYPSAHVLAPRALADRRPDLRIDGALEDALPELLTQAVDVLRIEGAPQVDEHVFFHRASRTLVVTDLVFNIVQPRGLFAHLVLFVMGVYKRLASSRAWRVFVKDRARCQSSMERVLALPFETLVMAHGEIVREDARARLTLALSWLLPAQQRVQPASTQSSATEIAPALTARVAGRRCRRPST